MRLPLIILSFLGYSSLLLAQSDRKIQWQDNVDLQWEDFQGAAPMGTVYKALTYSEVEIKQEAYRETELEFSLITYFVKDSSWRKSKDLVLLEHERYHFHMAELYARKMRKAIAALRPAKAEVLYKQLAEEKNRIFKDYIARDRMYDLETDHHRNQQKQKEWQALIDKEMDALQAYSSTTIKLTHIP